MNIKRPCLVLALSVAMAGPALAESEFSVVFPVKGKGGETQTTVASTQTQSIQLTLNPVSPLPHAMINEPYTGFDFKNALQVTGDDSYNPASVEWRGSVPQGLSLGHDGYLEGVPTLGGPHSFALSAVYKGQSVSQDYSLFVAFPDAGLSLTGLAAYYPLVGNATPSYGSLQLYALGSPSFSSATPMIGDATPGSLLLNGSSGVSNPNFGVVSGTGSVSVGAWIRTSSASAQMAVVQQRTYGSTVVLNGQFSAHVANGKFCYKDGSSTGFSAAVCHSQTVNDGEWHHVGFVRPAAGGIELFVDGAQQSFAYPVRAYQYSSGVSIGLDQRYMTDFFKGDISDVWFYNRALTVDEFKQAHFRRAPLQ